MFQSIVANGCFEADDGWWLIVDMWYRNGEALPEPYSKSNNKILYDRGGVATWVLAAMIGAADFLDQDDPLRAKAVECSKYFTLGEEASNNTDSQWWAVARSVEFTDSQS